VSSYDIPDKLVDLERAFLAAEARCAELAAAAPKAVDIAAGAEWPDRDRWDEAFAELQQAAAAVQGDEWWSTVDNRHEARAALLAAAKEQ
jgi:hypothetical protein